jgi:hypothetical protein
MAAGASQPVAAALALLQGNVSAFLVYMARAINQLLAMPQAPSPPIGKKPRLSMASAISEVAVGPNNGLGWSCSPWVP